MRLAIFEDLCCEVSLDSLEDGMSFDQLLRVQRDNPANICDALDMALHTDATAEPPKRRVALILREYVRVDGPIRLFDDGVCVVTHQILVT